jgi:hypothetical protein
VPPVRRESVASDRSTKPGPREMSDTEAEA